MKDFIPENKVASLFWLKILKSKKLSS